jgi:hypothetical protein
VTSQSTAFRQGSGSRLSGWTLTSR